MLGAIYIGLSGMNAYSKGLQTISNNVANLNSPGFKSSSVSFTDVFNYHGGGGLSYLGSGQSQRNGGGVRFGDPSVNYGQGDLREAEGDLDLGIDGSGFLVLLDGDQTFYARTGRFVVAEDGYIVLEGTEHRLAVLNADGRAEAVNLNNKQTSNPAATTKITFTGNVPLGGASAIVSDIAVYDSRGGKQVWKVSLLPGATNDEWKVTVTDQTGAAVDDTEANPRILKFIGGIVDPGGDQLTITDAPTGADPLTVILDFSTGVSSFSSVTSLATQSVDGNAAGSLTKVGLDADGKIKLTYSNTKTDLVGPVALADFRDPQQLDRAGNGLFVDRNGAYHRLLTSKQDGGGELKSKVLEASNVDLSLEFGDLILIQRGFQASSQVVSVTNDMIQQLFGIRGQG